MPTALVVQLRTTAVRFSEPAYAELEQLGLTHYRKDLDEEARTKRAALFARTHTAASIVREALERYGPWPADDGPPSAPGEHR